MGEDALVEMGANVKGDVLSTRQNRRDVFCSQQECHSEHCNALRASEPIVACLLTRY